MSERTRVHIVGGGFAGLACATELIQRGHEVTLWEREATLGGLAAGFREPEWSSSLEIFYHHWFASDSWVKRYASIWGLRDGLVFRRPTTVMESRDGRFLPLDSPLALLSFPDFPWLQRLRMGVVLAWLRLSGNWKTLDGVTAESWCRQTMGNAGFEAIWQPLLLGKFGPEHASRVNMAWLWARLHSRTPALGTYRGGFAAFVEGAGAWLANRGVVIRRGVADVHAVSLPGGRWEVTGGDRPAEVADALVVTAPPKALQSVLGLEAPPSVAARPTLGAVVVIVSLPRPLLGAGHYWYSLRKTAESPFLAVIDHSEFVSAAEFGGEHLVYVADYCATDSDAWRRSDEETIRLAIATLARISPDLSPDLVRRTWVFRQEYAQPVSHVNAGDSVPPLQVAGYPGLFHGTLEHVYPWDRGTNYALELGHSLANLAVRRPARL